ncbi:DUF192 domain-containing protein [Halomicrococcus gelatinilyticus]|uniref:DUF192 domain-containing protein n=1 Tax=Halomicrococcus gelatinilyticus TaxID=1702103 RepID=UPI002E0DACCD
MNGRAVLLVAALVVLAGCLTGTPNGGNGTDTTGTQTTTSHTTTDVEENVSAAFVVDGNRTAVTLEVADEPGERQSGLMYRQSLPRNHGMVFVYGGADERTFWMKNTLIPLDIVFVSANGTVVSVAHADPEPNAADSELRQYESGAPAKYVVEMRQGFANRTGVEPGTRLVFDGGPPTTEG